MKTELVKYLNLETLQPEYGVRVFVAGRWHNAARGGKPFIVKDVAEAEAMRKTLRKQSDAPSAALSKALGE